ncbi:short transient receptor potential channel 4-like isoform X2 [Ptychodera flava]
MAESKAALEQMYLASAEKGDLHVLETTLKEESEFDVNVRDSKGRSALALAIENGSIDVINMLLQHPIEIGDSLLLAIDNKFFRAVQVLVEHSKAKELINSHPIHDTEDYHPDTTPIIEAAHQNDYDTIELLISKGATPIDLSTIQSEKHTVQRSVGTLNIYKALASEAYLSYIELETKKRPDPFGRAFELSIQLRELSSSEYEFRQDYTELAERCEQFAADLLGQTRDANELSTVLNHRSHNIGNGRQSAGLPSKVYDAVKGVQKKFVTHPYCQQELIERWYKGLMDWRDKSSIRNFLLSTLIMLVMPFLSLLYIVYPYGKFGRFMRIPYVKFLTHTASYFYFVVILVMLTRDLEDISASSNLEKLDERRIRNQQRGPLPEPLEIVLFMWLVGMAWAEVKTIWSATFREYISNAWNLYNIIQLVLYVVWACLLTAAHFTVKKEEDDLRQRSSLTTIEPVDLHDGENAHTGLPTTDALNNVAASVATNMSSFVTTVLPSVSSTASTIGGTAAPSEIQPTAQHHRFNDYSFSIPLEEWSSTDLTLIAECVFAVANVVSIIKFLRIMVINDYVGPLQISFSKMISDIIQFMFVFIVIWIAFALGLTHIYWLYSASDKLYCMREGGSSYSCGNQPFSDIGSSLELLFWSLYGMVDLDILDVTAEHSSSEFVGRFLFGGYNVIAVVILLNLLIALMGTTYTNISEHADMEWKFSRSELWMDYFKHGTTLAPPFNVIPTPKTIVRLTQYLINNLCCRTCDKKVNWIKTHKETAANRNYKEVCKQLVQRYFSEKASEARDSGDGNAAKEDLVAIKQDLSAVRYDLYGIKRSLQKVTADFHKKTDSLYDGVSGARLDIERNKLQDNEVLKESRTEILNTTEEGNAMLRNLEEVLSRLKNELETLDAARGNMLSAAFKGIGSDLERSKDESTRAMQAMIGQIESKSDQRRGELMSMEDQLTFMQTRLEKQEKTSNAVADSVRELAKSIERLTSQSQFRPTFTRQPSGVRVSDIVGLIESTGGMAGREAGDESSAGSDSVFSV